MNNKNNDKKEQSLIRQISGALADEIRRGILPAGEKLPGERKLSIRFNASRGTVTEALNLLARKNLIERVPQSGSYVMKQYRRFAVVFPGDYASLPHTSSYENWQIISEIFRGALQEAVNNDAEAVLVCFDKEVDNVKLQNQMRRLRSFDAVFFLTDFQMVKLRECLRKENIPYTRLVDIRDTSSNPEILSRPDTEQNFHVMCQKIKDKKYQTVILLTTMVPELHQSALNEKLRLFKRIAKKYDLQTKMIHQDEVTEKYLSGLQSGKDVIYCENTEFIPSLYKIAAARQLIPGQSFGLTAYASGLTFANLNPAISYMKINHHMIGRYAIRKLNEILDGCTPPPHYVSGDFIDGETL